MELVFNDKGYDRLEVDPTYTHGLPEAVVASYRSRLQLLRATRDEGDLAAMRSLYFRPFSVRGRRLNVIRLTHEYLLVLEVQRRQDDVCLQIMDVRKDNVASKRSARS
jgi:plasmid maintenance system killer protein